MKVLYQDRGFSSKKFTIENDRIFIETNSFSKKTKLYVKLEKLGFDLQYVKKNYYPKKILFAICWLIPIVLNILYLSGIPDIALEGVFFFYIIAVVMSVIYSTDHYQDDIYISLEDNLCWHFTGNTLMKRRY